MSTLSIIIPCYNEEAVIMESYRRTKAVVDNLPIHATIIYVNDGSTDRTRELLNGIAAADARVSIIHFSRNFGHQPAVTAGIHHCRADLAIIMDADLQDPPELIPDILALREKEAANVVYCVRSSRKGDQLFKRATAKAFYRLMNAMSVVQFPLDAGDFRLIDRKVMNEFGRLKEHGKYIRGLISWIGFKQVPFYYRHEARAAGTTKYPLSKMIRFATLALVYFSNKPLRLAMGLGFTAVVVGLILTVWFALGKIYGFSHAESGWTSTITIITFFGGVQLLTVGMLGHYIGVLFDEVKARPEYIIDELVQPDKEDEA
ncbi:MAG: glycosyltransferase family 2 protein [Tannerellaceae bacterium]|jgi:dolichol-phosphate mannosyltransferase|nr:glycosyltransferase family 2 protein [Tannerellaceae bacterium]